MLNFGGIRRKQAHNFICSIYHYSEERNYTILNQITLTSFDDSLGKCKFYRAYKKPGHTRILVPSQFTFSEWQNPVQIYITITNYCLLLYLWLFFLHLHVLLLFIIISGLCTSQYWIFLIYLMLVYIFFIVIWRVFFILWLFNPNTPPLSQNVSLHSLQFDIGYTRECHRVTVTSEANHYVSYE